MDLLTAKFSDLNCGVITMCRQNEASNWSLTPTHGVCAADLGGMTVKTSGLSDAFVKTNTC